MRYLVVVDDEEILGNGGEPDPDYEIPELLRAGMFNVESITPLTED